jgi:hypothetical protein
MKFRGRSSIAADGKVVSTAVAKKEWFLKDLSGLPSQKIGWNGPTVYAVKDLERLALKVHGRDGLAKKREARKKRTEKKTAGKDTEKKKKVSSAGKNKKRKKHEEEEEEVDEGKEEGEEEQEKRVRQKWANKKDDDFVPEEEEKEVSKKDVKMPSGSELSHEQLMTLLKKRNETLPGVWVFQDCDETDSDLVLKLSKNGKSMSGECVIAGCKVLVKCSDLFNVQTAVLDFQAKFKTERATFTGRMLMRLTEKGKSLMVSYSNGAPGQGAVRFSGVTAKKKK